MNNRYKEMDDFLKYWRDILKENPFINLTENIVFNKIIKLGVNENDKNVNLSNNNFGQKSTFEKWIEYYYNNPNIKVFNSPDWKYFCQFISNYNLANATNHIKVYIPLDYEHIELGAKLIFDFLSNNNIPHHSKIGREIRFDDIVIRLINPTDAEKLINFVTSNQYLSKGLISPNPFAFQKDGIALACDGYLSYNSTISELITNYINYMKNYNKLDEINITSFYNYIIHIYNNNDLIECLFNDSDDLFSNRKQVLELIIATFSPNFTYNDYINHYKKHSNINSNVTNNAFYLNNALLCTVSEYDADKCYEALYRVINEGNYNYFTNKQNARNNLMNLSPSDIYHIVVSTLNKEKNNFNLYDACREYVDRFLANNTKDDNNINNNVSKNVFYLNNALLCTALKYDAYQCYEALYRVINEGNYNYFTNEKYARDNLMNLSPSDIYHIVVSTLNNENNNFNLYDACRKYVDRFLTNYTINDNNKKK